MADGGQRITVITPRDALGCMEERYGPIFRTITPRMQRALVAHRIFEDIVLHDPEYWSINNTRKIDSYRRLFALAKQAVEDSSR